MSRPATVTSVLAATEAVFGAVDILDSRYENFRFKLPDVVADNANAGGFILGRQFWRQRRFRTSGWSVASCVSTARWSRPRPVQL
jgi:2-keto-4-pentenoate hydratase